jgi:hypothetical protein
MQVLSDLLKMLEDFVKRALLPSTTFIAIFAIGSIFVLSPDTISNHVWYSYLKNIISSGNLWSYILVMVVFIGFSATMSLLTQLVFDVWLRYDFSFFSFTNSKLRVLRDKVVEKINQDNPELKLTEYNDWILYQVVGKYVKGYKRYADQTKLYGIVTISIIINIILYAIYINNLYCILFIVPVWLIGLWSIIATYRSRAYRYYLNYLTVDARLKVVNKNSHFTLYFEK